ncbi:MAG TPA: acyl carrier protein [Alphaproteobacteria bacterium]|nr:acyl carrier protein [Alphaproteobacteria bacterium]
MTRDEIKAILLEEIGNIAPEADLAALDPDADLREALDIDSISFLNLLIALGNRLGIQVPEKDYGRLATLRLAVEYLAAAH